VDRRALLVAALVAVVVVLFLWARDHRPGQPAPGDSPPADNGGPEPVPSNVNLALGNPSRAAADPADKDNYLLARRYFALSYNDAKGAPNWVSWCLRKEDLGSAARAEFYPDPDLPRGFKHVTPHDYTGSGFDRGHMCPRSDRTNTPEAAEATFTMTNIIPQAPHVNQKAWADFEDYCRDLVRHKPVVLYTVSGPAGKGGAGSKGAADAIAGGKVAVPAKCWKVVLVVEGGAGGPADASRVGPKSRLIAVVMPNNQSVGHGWAKYRTSAREVEELTGYRFFDRVPADVIGPLKAGVDAEHVATPHRPDRED
jgi:endonuclease G, mitochondrial